MGCSLFNLDQSARQVSEANNFGNLPIVSIKANSFFKPSFWTRFIPLKSANQLREEMHLELGKLSEDFMEIQADKSGHFVWMDQPDVMLDAVRILLDKINSVC